MKTKDIQDQNFEIILRGELDGIKDLELMILKGHILVEYSLNKFIDDTNEGILQIDDTMFNFSSKVRIAEFLGLFKKKDHLKESINILNKIRNQIAHQLEYDERLLQSLIKLFLEFNIEGSAIKQENEKLKNLYFIIIAICGLIMGKKLAQQKIKSFTRETLKIIQAKDPDKFESDFKNFKTI